jgi:hypothetical protein
MRLLISTLSALLCVVSGVVASDSSSHFTYNSSSFLLHGEPYQIIGGQMCVHFFFIIARLRESGMSRVYQGYLESSTS